MKQVIVFTLILSADESFRTTVANMAQVARAAGKGKGAAGAAGGAPSSLAHVPENVDTGFPKRTAQELGAPTALASSRAPKKPRTRSGALSFRREFATVSR